MISILSLKNYLTLTRVSTEKKRMRDIPYYIIWKKIMLRLKKNEIIKNLRDLYYILLIFFVLNLKFVVFWFDIIIIWIFRHNININYNYFFHYSCITIIFSIFLNIYMYILFYHNASIIVYYSICYKVIKDLWFSNIFIYKVINDFRFSWYFLFSIIYSYKWL